MVLVSDREQRSHTESDDAPDEAPARREYRKRRRLWLRGLFVGQDAEQDEQHHRLPVQDAREDVDVEMHDQQAERDDYPRSAAEYHQRAGEFEDHGPEGEQPDHGRRHHDPRAVRAQETVPNEAVLCDDHRLNGCTRHPFESAQREFADPRIQVRGAEQREAADAGI